MKKVVTVTVYSFIDVWGVREFGLQSPDLSVRYPISSPGMKALMEFVAKEVFKMNRTDPVDVSFDFTAPQRRVTIGGISVQPDMLDTLEQDECKELYAQSLSSLSLGRANLRVAPI